MSQLKATIGNKLNLQGFQSCQSVECTIWYNVDQVIVKIPVKKLYYIDMLIPKGESKGITASIQSICEPTPN